MADEDMKKVVSEDIGVGGKTAFLSLSVLILKMGEIAST